MNPLFDHQDGNLARDMEIIHDLAANLSKYVNRGPTGDGGPPYSDVTIKTALLAGKRAIKLWIEQGFVDCPDTDCRVVLPGAEHEAQAAHLAQRHPELLQARQEAAERFTRLED